MHFRIPLINARVQKNIIKMMDNDYDEMINPTDFYIEIDGKFSAIN